MYSQSIPRGAKERPYQSLTAEFTTKKWYPADVDSKSQLLFCEMFRFRKEVQELYQRSEGAVDVTSLMHQ